MARGRKKYDGCRNRATTHLAVYRSCRRGRPNTSGRRIPSRGRRGITRISDTGRRPVARQIFTVANRERNQR
nr:MAG TPA: hypothetical protein [Caudoviricetes sp.]